MITQVEAIGAVNLVCTRQRHKVSVTFIGGQTNRVLSERHTSLPIDDVTRQDELV